jgi:hypothetical protein
MMSEADRDQFEIKAENNLYENYENREAIRDKNMRSSIFGQEISPKKPTITLKSSPIRHNAKFTQNYQPYSNFEPI